MQLSIVVRLKGDETTSAEVYFQTVKLLKEKYGSMIIGSIEMHNTNLKKIEKVKHK